MAAVTVSPSSTVGSQEPELSLTQASTPFDPNRTHIDDIYESGLKWAYKSESEDDMPIDELDAAVSKASVPLDLETLLKHFYMWKEMKPEHLPLPPCVRILPKQDAFWNKMKHGSDTKTQACQSMKAPLPVDARGAKACDRMMMNMLADVHKGSQMFTADKDLTVYGDIEHFRNAASHRMTFRKCMIEMSKIFLADANGDNAEPAPIASVSPQVPTCVPNMSSI